MSAPGLDVLELHRQLVAIPSTSHDEEQIATFVQSWLEQRALPVDRIGRNVVARCGTADGPRLLLNSHLDTVPPSAAWTHDPLIPRVAEGRVFGLGSNDAKAAVACMLVALVRARDSQLPGEQVLMLVADEETGGEGTELAWPHLHQQGLQPDAVVVGEPTGLDIAASQMGMCIFELVSGGDACHSANARDLGARNAILALAEDLLALQAADLGPSHPELGRATLQPTVIQAGRARNMLPESASCILDVRTTPGRSHQELAASLRAVVQGELRVLSDRLQPLACPPAAAILAAARLARPNARIFGSRTMSDMVFFAGLPAIKCGPGSSARSHTPDEFVLEAELREGVEFYADLMESFSTMDLKGAPHESTVGQG